MSIFFPQRDATVCSRSRLESKSLCSRHSFHWARFSAPLYWKLGSSLPEVSPVFVVSMDTKLTLACWLGTILLNLGLGSCFASRGWSCGLILQFLQHCQSASIFSLSPKKCLVLSAEMKLPGFLLILGFWECCLQSASLWKWNLKHNSSCSFLTSLNEDPQAFQARTEWGEGEKRGLLKT